MIGREVGVVGRQPHRHHLKVGDAKDQDIVENLPSRLVDDVVTALTMKAELLAVDKIAGASAVTSSFTAPGMVSAIRSSSLIVTTSLNNGRIAGKVDQGRWLSSAVKKCCSSSGLIR